MGLPALCVDPMVGTIQHRHLGSYGRRRRLITGSVEPGLFPFSPAPTGIPAIISHHLKILLRDMLSDGGDEFLGGEDLEVFLVLSMRENRWALEGDRPARRGSHKRSFAEPAGSSSCPSLGRLIGRPHATKARLDPGVAAFNIKAEIAERLTRAACRQHFQELGTESVWTSSGSGSFRSDQGKL
jgi:hypothetical protein